MGLAFDCAIQHDMLVPCEMASSSVHHYRTQTLVKHTSMEVGKWHHVAVVIDPIEGVECRHGWRIKLPVPHI